MTADVERLLAGARAAMRRVPYCWLATRSEDGAGPPRPMGRLPRDPGDDDWTLRFVTDGRSAKVRDLRRDPRAGLVLQDEAREAWLSLAGRADLLDDAAEVRRRWQPAYEAYFPTPEDRAAALFLVIRIDTMDLWIRGVTPEPFGLRATRLVRRDGAGWECG